MIRLSFLGWSLRERGVRARMKAWKDERHAELRILCFSAHWSEPLLWGHYANKHRGIAIGFDVPAGDIYHPVEYQDHRLPVPLRLDLVGTDVDKLLLTKFSAWKYENEHRCFCRLDESVNDGNLYFDSFSATLKPVEVIVGDRAPLSRADIAIALGSLSREVEIFKARPAFGGFTVVRNLNDRLWK